MKCLVGKHAKTPTTRGVAERPPIRLVETNDVANERIVGSLECARHDLPLDADPGFVELAGLVGVDRPDDESAVWQCGDEPLRFQEAKALPHRRTAHADVRCERVER